MYLLTLSRAFFPQLTSYVVRRSAQALLCACSMGHMQPSASEARGARTLYLTQNVQKRPKRVASSFFWLTVMASCPLTKCMWPFSQPSNQGSVAVLKWQASVASSINSSNPTFPSTMLRMKGTLKRRCEAALKQVEHVHGVSSSFSQFKQDKILWRQHFAKQCSQRNRIYVDVGVSLALRCFMRSNPA